ncbi:di-heme oxidoreductase family protein [Marinomonas epiphytica]
MNILKNAGLVVSFFYCSSLLATSYTQPLTGLSSEEKFDYHLGDNVFKKFWIPSPSSTTASDGLGPLFNARSCNNCHLNNGRGHAPEEGVSGKNTPSFLVRLGPKNADVFTNSEIFNNTGDPTYGKQFQIDHTAGVQSEGDYQLTYQYHTETLADGTKVRLKKPLLRWTQLHYGDLHHNTGISMRVSPPLVGMGLLDNITPESLIALADPEDSNNDGISGRVSYVMHDDTKVVGKFGYKATMPSATAQNQNAFNTDLGLSTPLFTDATGDCTTLQVTCKQAPNGNSQHLGDLEADATQVRLVDTFVALSAPPAMRNLQEPWFIEARDMFYDLGCAACHTPKMQTGTKASFPALSNRTFYPFTDMLLHDMGVGLASDFPEGSASPQEWRTAPLWGIGLSEHISNRRGFLHDGRAETVEEAILWHGGEASKSQQAYKLLDKRQRTILIKFLESL